MPEETRSVVNSTDLENQDVTVEIVRPNAKHLRDAQLEYNRAFRDALESGALLRQKLEDEMRRQKIWDDEKQKRYDEINREILGSERKLKAGGIKLREARQVAIDMRTKRAEFRELISERTSMDGNTAEGQADNARFNKLASICIVNEGTNTPYFSNTDDYEEKAASPFVIEAAGKLANMMYGLDDNYDNNLPENKFLRKFKFADKESRLLNEDGDYIDMEGKLIDEEGYYIDKKGNRVDLDGNAVGEDGEYIVDEKPFLDDDGNPVDMSDDEETETEDEAKAETETETEDEAKAETETEDEAKAETEDEAKAEEPKKSKSKT